MARKRTRKGTGRASGRPPTASRGSPRGGPGSGGQANTAPSAQLLKMVVALIGDRSLQRRFNENPALLVEEYGLTPQEKQAIYTLAPDKVAKAVAGEIVGLKDEIERAQLKEIDFPPCSEDYEESGGPAYPDPKPQLHRLRPTHYKRLDKGGNKEPLEELEIVVTGQSFSRQPNAQLRVTGPTKLTVQSELYGTLRCSRLWAKLTPESPAKEISPGKYKVRVVTYCLNDDESEGQKTIDPIPAEEAKFDLTIE